MSTRLVAVLLVGALAFAPALMALEDPADSQLEEGIEQAQLGDFEKAIVTLDAAARRLTAEGGRSRDLARAYVYLSIAYLGLSQEQKAKAQFLEALKADTEMEIDAGEFPPRILEFQALDSQVRRNMYSGGYSHQSENRAANRTMNDGKLSLYSASIASPRALLLA